MAINYYRLLSECNANHQKLLDELKELQAKYQDTLSQSIVLSEELNAVKTELEVVLKEKEEDCVSYKSQLDEIKQYVSDITMKLI